MHRAFPDLRNNTNSVVGDAATLAALSALRVAIGARLLSVDRAARLTEWLQRLLPGNAAQLIKSGSPPPLFAVAIGTHSDHPATAATALAQLPG